MKVYNIYKSIASVMLLAAVSHGMVSCSDTWDDHYDVTDSNGTESLLQLVESDPQLSDFRELLGMTHIYRNHRTSVTYADLLDGDQSLTVWAPINGTFNFDSLRTLCLTEKGDSTVGQHFVQNHIARNLYNMNSQTDESVKMLNDKFLTLSPTALYNATVQPGHYNLPANNGLLHVIDKDAAYTYNIYEGLTSLDEFNYLGTFLSSYEKQELDEENSIEAGIEDGNKVYSDSVMVKRNDLFHVFDQIMSEDSTYTMLVPDKATWQAAYDEAKPYFNFSTVEKGDSISEYWTNVSLMRDLIINRNRQRSEQDSIFTTSYSFYDWPYHVYYKPFEPGGLMDPANIIDSLLCSNGYIYRMKQWPFTAKELYFHPITTQGEWESSRKDYTFCTFNNRSVIGDTISGNAYVDIVAQNNRDWTVTYEINNTLSGTYNVYAVILPKTVYLANSRDFKPNKFYGSVTYIDEQGEKKTVAFGNANNTFSNDPYRADSVLIGQCTLPVCNYQQPDATVSVTLNCSVRTNEAARYSREMFLDCIYFEPVTDDDAIAAETKKRKEARK
ncbi:MAG: hypothetical protein J1F40_06145 [Prevotellaceae bacterium]|nr:hypothetical protein [Prevotellaceae bacterium]